MNNFVVSVPKELKTIQSKLLGGLTKRQLIGFSIGIVLGFLVFLLIKPFSLDIAMYGLFFTVAPIIFITIYKKDGIYLEKWLKIYLEHTKFFSPKRYFRVSKRNMKIAKERKMLSAKKTRKNTKNTSSIKTVKKKKAVSSTKRIDGSQ